MRRILVIAILLVVLLVTLAACGSTAKSPTPFTSPTTQGMSIQETQSPNPTSTSTATTMSVQKNSPVNITTFASANEGEQNRFYFLLEASDGRNVVADGHIQLQIFDDLNNSLYLKELDVKTSEYVGYQYKLTGQSMGKAYEWRVPVTDIKKGISSIGWGRAVLTFTTIDGKRLSAEDKTIQIPVYTDDELKQIAEDEYAKSAKSTTLIAQDDNFEVRLIKYGLFTDYSFGKSDSLLRADFTVVSKMGDYFWSTDAKLIDSNNKQYEASYKSEFEGGKLAVNTTRTGYIAFENVPENVQISNIVIQDYVFDLSNNKAYTYGQLAEEEYAKYAIILNQKIIKGVFEVTVNKAGFFNHENKEYLRVDMQVKNIGSSMDYFLPSGMAILDNQGNQYENKYGGTLDTFSQIHPNITEKGYILFEGVPKTIGTVKLVFELGNDAQYNPYLFEYNITLK
jgi:hypothetical protein